MCADLAPLVLIGPGGVGKGTIARLLVERDPSLWLSRSWTTRERRPSEDGSEYIFVSREQFERAIADGLFLEWAEFHGNLMGSPLPDPHANQRGVFEIEAQGAEQILRADPSTVVILIEPPSIDELAARLQRRGDDDAHIARRLASTPSELARGREVAQYVVVNDDLDAAVREIFSILDGSHRAG